MGPVAERESCSTIVKIGQASCGSRAGQGELPNKLWEKVKNHPCYSEDAHHYYARMHVAVAPACNIQCNYCNRKYDCANESRPGVVSEKLTPEQALRKVIAVATTIPQMTVLGIAGPGDPLANPAKTFKTFELVTKAAPDIKLCLSTNGLALPDYVDTIVKAKIDHVTITVNMIDPQIGAKIYPWIFFNHKRYTGVEAARILTQRQLLGLEMLSDHGILCKINSVMIPGINDDHLVEVNKAVTSRGAFLHNIMPLISAPDHGTAFGLKGQRGPTAQELKALQDACEGQISMMRHCRQCRADAVGLLGEDRSAQFSMDQVMKMDVRYDLEKRKAYQKRMEDKRVSKVAIGQHGLTEVREEMSAITLLVAVATKGSGLINEHFGHAKELLVYELSTSGAKLIGPRRVQGYCQGGYGEEEKLSAIMRDIRDCHAVFVAKIGGSPKTNLIKEGIEPVDQFAYELIEKSMMAWFRAYLGRVKRGEVHHAQRGNDACRLVDRISAA
ncbi:nitrogenase cofactor biosynthesis protein NifB [Bradyrhizobium centrosematis]|uniref:nitrogenase cofactor biosynthesis protein NifB n=1 Tax=Bradyrhizobium centrosematis TaxID=1300039 RepID=UPI003890A50A